MLKQSHLPSPNIYLDPKGVFFFFLQTAKAMLLIKAEGSPQRDQTPEEAADSQLKMQQSKGNVPILSHDP